MLKTVKDLPMDLLLM